MRRLERERGGDNERDIHPALISWLGQQSAEFAGAPIEAAEFAEPPVCAVGTSVSFVSGSCEESRLAIVFAC